MTKSWRCAVRTKNKRADRVWNRLIQSYGTRVAEMYGIDMPKPWIDAVDDLSDEQIAYGLRVVLRESPIHPPPLGQFIQCCVNMPGAQVHEGPSVPPHPRAYAAFHLPPLHPPPPSYPAERLPAQAKAATTRRPKKERALYKPRWGG